MWCVCGVYVCACVCVCICIYVVNHAFISISMCAGRWIDGWRPHQFLFRQNNGTVEVESGGGNGETESESVIEGQSCVITSIPTTCRASWDHNAMVFPLRLPVW